jgi:hypothetical protein
MVGKHVNGRLQNTITALLTDRPIAYHPIIAKTVKSVTAGVFLSQFLYWTPRTKDPQGWIYKTQADIYEETALTRREQETARRILRNAGVLEEKKAGVPCRLYFRVNMAALVQLLGEETTNPAEFQDGGNSHPGMADADPPACPKAPDRDGHTEQPINRKTENTIQENTTESEDTHPKPTDEHSETPTAVEDAQPEETAENQTIWNKAIEQVKRGLPLGDTGDRLQGTTLIEVTSTRATISVPNRTAVAWFERRLYSPIANAMKEVLSHDLDLRFIAAS